MKNKKQAEENKKTKNTRSKIEIPGTYGNITVLCVDTDSGKPYKMYYCRCEICGNIFSQRGQDVLKYQNRGCPDCRKRENKEKREAEVKGYIGKIYGELEVIGFAGMTSRGSRSVAVMTCKCHKCQSITNIPLPRLKAGQAKECAECARKNLKIGNEIIKDAAICGTSILAIDGRRQKNKNNKSGHNGVSWLKHANKWRAYIYFRGKQYYLGLYDKLDDAINARKAAEKEIYGSFLTWYAENHPEEWKKLRNKTKESIIKQ